MVRRPALDDHREERIQQLVVLREVVGVGPGVEPRRWILTFAEEPGDALTCDAASYLDQSAGAHPQRAHAEHERVRREDAGRAARRRHLVLPEIQLRRERGPDVEHRCRDHDFYAVQRRRRPVEGAEIQHVARRRRGNCSLSRVPVSRSAVPCLWRPWCSARGDIDGCSPALLRAVAVAARLLTNE